MFQSVSSKCYDSKRYGSPYFSCLLYGFCTNHSLNEHKLKVVIMKRSLDKFIYTIICWWKLNQNDVRYIFSSRENNKEWLCMLICNAYFYNEENWTLKPILVYFFELYLFWPIFSTLSESADSLPTRSERYLQ